MEMQLRFGLSLGLQFLTLVREGEDFSLVIFPGHFLPGPLQLTASSRPISCNQTLLLGQRKKSNN